MGQKHSLPKKIGGSQSSLNLSKEKLEDLTEHSHFTYKEVERLSKAFEEQAKPGTTITKAQFIHTLENHVQCWSAGAQFMFLDRLFNAFDLDGSGNIDFEEFIEGLSVFLRGVPDEKVAMTFRLYDIDNSGSIEPKELIKIMSRMYSAFYNEDQTEKITSIVNQVFLDLDINGDGSLSLTEFKLMALKEPLIVDFLEQFLLVNPDSSRTANH